MLRNCAVGFLQIVAISCFQSLPAEAQNWTTWSRCPKSFCFKSRIRNCTIGKDLALGFDCAQLDEPYVEILSAGCDATCSKWTNEIAKSDCNGICYYAKIEYEYMCATQTSCKKTQLKRCYNPTTCMGRWVEQSTDSCSVTCGVGTKTSRQTCKLKSHDSLNCPDTFGRISSRTIQEECYNCQTWGNWSDYTHCNSSCWKSKHRKCQVQISPSCGNFSILEIQQESCLDGECSSSTYTTEPKSSSLYSYLAYIGGGTGFILLVMIIAITIKTKQNKKEPEPAERSERVYITEIERFSPTTGRRRHSFGSHYEDLAGNIYADPDEMLSKKQKLEKEKYTGKDRKEHNTAKGKTKMKNIEEATPYSMAENIEACTSKSTNNENLPWQNNADNTTDVDFSDSFEDDDDYHDEQEQSISTVVNYDTINYAQVNIHVKKAKGRKNAKEKKRHKSSKKKEDKKAVERKTGDGNMDQPSPYYETTFTNRGFVGEFTPPVIPNIPLKRSTTKRNVTSPKKALMLKRKTVYSKYQTRGRSVTQLECSTENARRDRSVTEPVQPVFTPPTSPSYNQPSYTDMSAIVPSAQNVQYTDMYPGYSMANAVVYTDMSRGYTDMMSAAAVQVPDAYSMGNEIP